MAPLLVNCSSHAGALALASMLTALCACQSSGQLAGDTHPDGAILDAGAAPDSATPPLNLGCDQLDVLFVIDNSVSMQQEQENLAANFGRFVDKLRAFRDGQVNFRVGVTTTGVPWALFGTPPPSLTGTLLKTADMREPWLDSRDPELPEKFAQLATVGTDGSWDEQPLKSTLAALTERISDGTNGAFLRPNALLALVIVTDEDDVSADGSEPIPVGDFVAALDAVKRQRQAWSAAVIAGGEAPTCSSSFGTAVFAARLMDFVTAAGEQGVFSSICQGDLSVSLDTALATFANACDVYVW